MRARATFALLLAACSGSMSEPAGPVEADGGGQPAEDEPGGDEPAGDVTVHVDLAEVGSTIAPDAIGFGLEYHMVGSYLGRTPDQLNPVFRRLLENLGRGTLRVGGTSTDTSCWRTAPGAALPAGCAIEISPNALRVVSATMAAVDWRAILGVDLVHYSPTTALDYARDGVRVNCICPGWVETGFNDPVIAVMGGDDAVTAAVDAYVPMGRQGVAEEIAEVALFLASDASSLMTGSIVVADAGFTAM